ncbi:MAG: bifunctional (p)ppGpp synthetase/guanosine-3',5'-bis(diphosphate) 3'-pyrophosphohydrolase, partial [Clostridia bacterium]|nr:bifunctional (p)ppGpp synthetase/guanosine-3',5'-bis(diphosphate) 3'-pyrophosphohydrolase [Clostridia bacterium]
LCFKYLYPEEYENLVAQINQKREQQEEYIKTVLDTTRARTVAMGIRAFFDGRPKHLYSVRKKMINQNKTLDQIYDLLAIRIIVDTVPDCYVVLGILHDLYKPMPGRFKDYIAMPKPNQYQSLHTTLIGPGGFAFEAQIRTWEMHKTAEIGIAAHWKYKADFNSTTRTTADFDKKLEWVRNLFDLQKDMNDSTEFVEAFKMDLFTDEVFVFTPKGDVKSLPAGSTPIDFAYAIHSAVGNRMVGAKVNGEIKPLNYRLKNGDIVEIITSASLTKGPSRDWLSIVKSSQAKSKIRQWFKKERREENIERGHALVEQELKRIGYNYSQLFKGNWIDTYLRRYNLNTIDDLMNVIGFGEMSAKKTVTRLKDEYERVNAEKLEDEIREEMLVAQQEEQKREVQKERSSENGIIVKGIENCLVRLAHCCNPVPGDSIVGYITRGRGVSVHRIDCPNVMSMNDNEENRMINVRWANASSATHLAEVVVKAVDNRKLLLQVANLINDMRIAMKSINARTTRDAYQIIDLVIEIGDRAQLDSIIEKLKQLDNVVEVSRAVR